MNLIKTGFSANQLKLAAIAAMTIDHFASVLFPHYPTDWWILLLHVAGRIAAPIMWFFIAEGYFKTRDVKRYGGRLFLFAVVSHFAYNFAFGIPFLPFQTSVFNQTSVIWTLAWGLTALAIDQSRNPKWKPWMKHGALLGIAAVTFCADWSCIGMMSILEMGRHRGDFRKQMWAMVRFVSMYAIVYILFVNPVYGAIQMFVVLAIPLLRAYNGQRGGGSLGGMKWFFYIYYPAHLILAGLVRLWLYGDIGVMIGG